MTRLATAYEQSSLVLLTLPFLTNDARANVKPDVRDLSKARRRWAGPAHVEGQPSGHPKVAEFGSPGIWLAR